jgi:hypothetical protein
MMAATIHGVTTRYEGNCISGRLIEALFPRPPMFDSANVPDAWIFQKADLGDFLRIG